MKSNITTQLTTIGDKVREAGIWFEARKHVAIMSLAALVAQMEADAAVVNQGSWVQGQQTQKKFTDLADTLTETADTGASLFFNLIAIFGFVLIALGLYQLYKASKDEREKPMSAVVGIIVGGLMSGAGVIAWAIRNELFTGMGVGTGTAPSN